MTPSPKHHRSAQASTESIPTWGWWVIGSFLFLILVTVLSVVGFFSALASAIGYGISASLPLLLFVLAGVLYFIPTLCAQGSPRDSAVFVANLVFGWTIIGWIIVLIWALAESGTAKAKR